MAFLSAKKKKSTKPDGTVILSSVLDIKKYNDAIKWGALHAEQALPSNYYRKMEGFILSYQKEHKQVQKEGYPLPHVVNSRSEKLLMYIFILPWAVTNIWVGSWLILIQAKRHSAFYHCTGKIKHTRLSFGVWSYVLVAFWQHTAQLLDSKELHRISSVLLARRAKNNLNSPRGRFSSDKFSCEKGARLET